MSSHHRGRGSSAAFRGSRGNRGRGGGAGRGRSNRDEQIAERYMAQAASYGNTPEEIRRWQRERKAKFPRASTAPPSQSLLCGYYSSSGSSSDDAAPREMPSFTTDPHSLRIDSPVQRRLCQAFIKGVCSHGDLCSNLHDHAERRAHLARSVRSAAPTLLESLLASEMERECTLLLECFQSLAKDNLL